DDVYAALHAVRLAIRERNAAGGAAGRQVALVALNDNGRPDEARQQAATLGVDRDVLGVIGPLHGDTAVAAGPVLAAEGLPWIALGSLASAQQPAGFALEVEPARLASQASETLAKQGVSGPVALVGEATLAPSDLAGVIWLGDAAGGATLARSLEPGTALIGGPELGSPVFAGRAGAAAEGVSWLSAGPGAASLPDEFVAAYRSLAGVPPSPQAVLAYDAANLLMDALDRAGRQSRGLTRAAVLQALAELGGAGWQGLSGPVIWQRDACPAAQPCWPRLDPNVTTHRW
ncbi:MAG TPA: ABC transporter substrate-binding protein, partial [Anaerolineae bacterium]|nr:ABC transporter substrate-binding protein [Anaerolineae bacterium]